jgi:hypothetical protein
MLRNAISIVAIAVALLCAADSQPKQVSSSGSASASPQLPAGAMQQKATTACMECHDASILVQQRLDRKVWTKEVDKMIRWGAVVDPKDRDPLIEYFATNFGPDKPPYIAPRRRP